MFDPTFFYHKTCMRRKDEMEKAEAEKREKIEIVKTAMRELAAEKQNDELCRESASRSPVTS